MKRVYEQLLEQYLGSFPCVAILGPRQCGKTTLLRTLKDPWRIYDLERGSDLQVISRDPDLFLRLNPDDVAVDEAQLFPELFPALRSHRPGTRPCDNCAQSATSSTNAAADWALSSTTTKGPVSTTTDS